MKEKAGVTETMLETPKAKTNLLDDHSEFMRQMDERFQDKINEILNMTPTKKAIKEAKNSTRDLGHYVESSTPYDSKYTENIWF